MIVVLKKCVPLQCFNKRRLFYRFKKLRKMKKLVFMFVAIAAISFASCGENKTAAAEETVDTTAQDTTAVQDTTAAPVDTTTAE